MDPAEDKNLDYEQGTVSNVALHDAVRREDPLQPAGRGSVGISVIALCSLILIFGGGHLFSTSNGFRDSIYVEMNYVAAPRPALGPDLGEAAQIAWIDKWMREGKRVYNNCIACHQASGSGIPGQFPPLVGSEWVDGGTKRLGAILLHGANGTFRVAGQTYNQLMPAWNQLSNDELAAVITYIRREFGSLPEGDDGVVTTEMMVAARELFQDQAQPYTEGELLEIPEDANLPGAQVDLETGEPL